MGQIKIILVYYSETSSATDLAVRWRWRQVGKSNALGASLVWPAIRQLGDLEPET